MAKPGEVYAIYLPCARPSGTIDLSGATGRLKLRWYNPRTGRFEGRQRVVEAGARVRLGDPPSSAAEDWAVLIRK